MQHLYHMFESALMWGTVVFALGLVAYLSYKEYRKLRRRRSHRDRKSTRLNSSH